MNSIGFAYKDQEAAERAADNWRAEYSQAMYALIELNERLDSKSLDEQIQYMARRLNRS